MRNNVFVVVIIALFVFSSVGFSADVSECSTILEDSVVTQDILYDFGIINIKFFVEYECRMEKADGHVV